MWRHFYGAGDIFYKGETYQFRDCLSQGGFSWERHFNVTLAWTYCLSEALPGIDSHQQLMQTSPSSFSCCSQYRARCFDASLSMVNLCCWKYVTKQRHRRLLYTLHINQYHHLCLCSLDEKLRKMNRRKCQENKQHLLGSR